MQHRRKGATGDTGKRTSYHGIRFDWACQTGCLQEQRTFIQSCSHRRSRESLMIQKKQKIHTRRIDIATYAGSEDAVIVEGILMALQRFKNTCWVWREDGPLMEEFKDLTR